MDLPTAFITRRIGQGATGTIYRIGNGHAVKVLSAEYIAQHLLPKANSAEEVSAMCRLQLGWEHEVASGLRAAGVESAVKTYGVHEVRLRWFDTHMRAANRLALVMDYVPGLPLSQLDEINAPVALSRLGAELQKARCAGYIPDEEADDLTENALFDNRTSRLTLVDFSLWSSINPYRPHNGTQQLTSRGEL